MSEIGFSRKLVDLTGKWWKRGCLDKEAKEGALATGSVQPGRESDSNPGTFAQESPGNVGSRDTSCSSCVLGWPAVPVRLLSNVTNTGE